MRVTIILEHRQYEFPADSNRRIERERLTNKQINKKEGDIKYGNYSSNMLHEYIKNLMVHRVTNMRLEQIEN